MITAIARIKPIELIMARPFRRERFFETRVKVRRQKSPLPLFTCIVVRTQMSKFLIRTVVQDSNRNRTKVGEGEFLTYPIGAIREVCLTASREELEKKRRKEKREIAKPFLPPTLRGCCSAASTAW